MRDTAAEARGRAGAWPAEVPPLPPRLADVSLHFLGDGGVLFDAASQKVYAANTMATFIWCCLEEGEAPPGIAGRLQQTFGLSHPDAVGALDAALASWREIGLVDRASPVAVAPPSERRGEIVEPIGSASAGMADEYRLLDLRIRLRCWPPRLRRRVVPALMPLADRSGGADLTVVELDVALRDGRFVLAAGATVIDECVRWDGVVPMLKAQLNMLALRHSRDFAALHAAAVSRGERCVLLPAESGRGKSTLTAALAAAGFLVLGDDTVVLDRDALHARPMPFGICVKSGAWRLLASRFPALARRPTHRRPDGKIVRYLLPRDGGAWAPAALRQAVGWIVFPMRRDSGRAELRPVAKLDALSRLLGGFYPLGPGLDARRVDRLVAWLDGTRCLELRYASLDDAVDRVKGLA